MALTDPASRLGTLTAFLVTASGIGFAGIGAASWGLFGGMLVRIGIERRG